MKWWIARITFYLKFRGVILPLPLAVRLTGWTIRFEYVFLKTKSTSLKFFRKLRKKLLSGVHTFRWITLCIFYLYEPRKRAQQIPKFFHDTKSSNDYFVVLKIKIGWVVFYTEVIENGHWCVFRVICEL